VSRAGDLEVDFVLALQLDFAIVQPPGKVHRAVDANQGVVVEALNFGGVKFSQFDARL
jgi:hypothetical protein